MPVSRVGSVRLGRQRSPDKHTGRHPTKYLRAGNITSRGLDVTDVLEMDFTPQERRVFGLRRNDVVLAEASGSASQVGRGAIWREEIPDCCYQNTVIRFRPHAVSADYGLLVFRHYAASGLFAKAARGVGILHLGASRFASLPFPVPPEHEQARIVEEFRARELALRQAEASLLNASTRLREQVREVLAAAATGELTTRDASTPKDSTPDDAPRRGLRPQPGQGRLFENTTGTSANEVAGLYHIPDAWRWVHVEEVGELRAGKQLTPQSRSGPNQRRYLRVANVLEDRIDYSDLKKMHFTKEEHALYKLQVGDVLLNDGQSPELAGRPAIYRGEVRGLCFQNHIIRFRPSSAVSPDYALIVFRHYLHAGEFLKIARWSTNIANLGLRRLAALPFPLPPVREQREIVKVATKRLQTIERQLGAVQASISRLPDMERELLAAAVSGALVPQRGTDEPAAQLLHRMGPPAENEPPPSPSTLQEDDFMDKEQQTVVAQKVRSLAAVLQEAGQALTLPDLFSRAGFDRDSTEDVEQFYLLLRSEFDRTIQATVRRPKKTSVENATLEVIRR